ncbi:MAG TPA: periplasmic heavy metal sensor [Pyrinomonadaceae bacterium]|nr:periplasmic heavy metal sensor [Pyrinomonadaceae bacterium]
MKLRTIALITAILFLTHIGPIGLIRPIFAQDPEAPLGAADPIQQLRLSPEQRQRIRRILAQNKDERQATNQRLRQARLALDQALDADPVDENLVEQRVNDLAAAQAAQLRMRIQTELQIRRELRPEQLATLRRLRLRANSRGSAR